jgi:hypothetical protein
MKTANCIHGSRSRLATGLVFCLIAWAVGSPRVMQAQITKATASVNGTVRDPSGGVVPGAMVTLTNILTGVKWTTTTNGVGDYVILQVPPGQYTLSVSKEGFRTVREEEFSLDVNQAATFNVTLLVGSAMQSVTVKAAAVRINSTSAALGTTISDQEINSLPVNGRNFTMFLTLSPGVSPINNDENNGAWGTGAVGSFTFPAVNGQTNRSNMFWVDGVNDYGSFVSTYGVAPILDDVAEFKSVTQSDQAQFGGVTGAMANLVTKSGTNQFHGDVWEFAENGALNARNFFLPTVGQFNNNQFGGTLGGPVIIPHVYNGRNKTFFFLAYEGFRSSAPAQSLYVVPTAAELAGDLNDAYNPFPIYNPFSTRPDPSNPGQFIRDPFPNNQIPSNLIDPKMILYAQTILPKPVVTGISSGPGAPPYNGLDDSPSTSAEDTGTFRLDEVLGSKDRLFGRWTGVTQVASGSAGFVGFKNFTYLHGDNVAAGWSHAFGPSALLTVGYGRTFVSDNGGTRYPNVNGPALMEALGLQPVLWSFPNNVVFIPGMGIPGYAGGGEGYSDLHPSDDNEWKVDFVKIYNRHSFGAGLDISQNRLIFPCYFTGVSFCPFQTSNLETGVGGSGLAAFLLGVPNGAGLGKAPVYNTGGWVDGLYGQDQWKVTDKLTLNLGLRYDLPFNSTVGRASDRSNEVGNWDFNTGNYVLQEMAPPCSATVQAPCIPGGTLPAHVIVEQHPGQSLVHNAFDNLGPRIGLAYRLTPSTALRASYGRFFDTWADVTQNQLNYSGSWPDTFNLGTPPLNLTTVNATAETPFPAQDFALPAPNPYFNVVHFSDPNAKDAESDQWHFQIERELPQDTVLAVAYVGSHTIRIPEFFAANASSVPGPVLKFPYPYTVPQPYYQTVGKSTYNSLQVSLNKASRSGLAFQFSYTYSKVMDFGCDGNFTNCDIQNPYQWQANYGVAQFDQTNNLTASWVWPLPIGPGKKWLSSNRFWGNIAGGWQLNGIGFIASGEPYDVSASTDILNLGISGAGAGEERLDIIGNPYLGTNRLQPINPAAFATPAPYTIGDLGRNTFRGPTNSDLDLSLFREFAIPVREGMRLQFRLESFNSLNEVVFGLPDTFIGDPTFGQVRSQQNSPRVLQIALKLYF